jgi:hypothetical protein
MSGSQEGNKKQGRKRDRRSDGSGVVSTRERLSGLFSPHKKQASQSPAASPSPPTPAKSDAMLEKLQLFKRLLQDDQWHFLWLRIKEEFEMSGAVGPVKVQMMLDSRRNAMVKEFMSREDRDALWLDLDASMLEKREAARKKRDVVVHPSRSQHEQLVSVPADLKGFAGKKLEQMDISELRILCEERLIDFENTVTKKELVLEKKRKMNWHANK